MQTIWPQGQTAAADIWGTTPGAQQPVPGQTSQQQQVMQPQTQTSYQQLAHPYFPVPSTEAGAWHVDPNRRVDQRQPQPQEADANQALRLPSRFGRRAQRSQTHDSDEAYVEDFTRMLFDQRLQESQSQGW